MIRIIMKEFIILALTGFLKTFVFSTQGISNDIIQPLTWRQAVKNCSDKGGKLLSFKTGLEIYLDKLHLNSAIDVWTADYLQTSSDGEEFCGFNYLNTTLYDNTDVFYGECNVSRNYFCKETGQQKLVVYSSTRSNVRCNYLIKFNDLLISRFEIKPGFYWARSPLKGIRETLDETWKPRNAKVQYCGAYKDSVGEYYANCSRKRFSLCDAGSTSSKDNINTQSSEGIGIKVGISIGIMLPVISGIFIVIYIYRNRINSLLSRKSKHENGQINQYNTQRTLRVNGQPNVYTESNQDTPMSSDMNEEYAVVMKPKKDKISSRLEKFSDKTSNNATHNEYDSTINFRSGASNLSNNIYNYLERDDYNTACIPRRPDEHNNMYDITIRNDPVESAYDSTSNVNGSVSPDDTYNHVLK